MLLMKRLHQIVIWYLSVFTALGLVAWFLRLNRLHPLAWQSIAIHAVLCVSVLVSAILIPGWIYFRIAGRGKRWQRASIHAVNALWIGVSLGLAFETGARIFPIHDTAAVNPAVQYFRPGRPWNMFGHKDREFSLDHAPTTFRILAVGDSYVEGVGVALDETFAAVLEQRMNTRLRAANPGLAVEVFNLGHSGRNTQEEVGLILQDAPLLTPDLVLLTYVLNDAEQHPDPLTTNVKPVWLQWSVLNDFFFFRIRSYAFYWLFVRSSQRIDGVQLTVAQHAPDYPGWQQVEHSLDQYRQYLEQTGVGDLAILFPLLVPGEYPAQLTAIHRQIAQAFETRGLAIADLLPVFQAQGKPLDAFKFSADDGHPDRAAHALIGNLLADTIVTRPDFQRFVSRNAAGLPPDLSTPDAPAGNEYQPEIEQALDLARRNAEADALERVNRVIAAFEQTIVSPEVPVISAWAADEYRDYVRLHPQTPVQWVAGAYKGAYLLKAQLVAAAGDVEGALACLDHVLTISPYDALAHSLRGTLLHQRQRSAEALWAFQTAYTYAMRYDYHQAQIPMILQSIGDLYRQRGYDRLAQLAYYEAAQSQQRP